MPPAIPFETFMARALYDPERGYYARRISGIGARGDFTTAPMLSSTLAKAIASWVTKALRETHCRDLIEIGPGEGKLAAAVWSQLPWTLRLRTRLHLVETSLPLADSQRKLLGNKAIWHESPLVALSTCKNGAVIFSNELVDAFPVRLFEKTSENWQEVAVSFDSQNRATETLLPPSLLPPSSSFQGNFPPGQRVEVHDSYRFWLEKWLPNWKNGRLLTIDYGATAESLYHRRPRGTLRAYLLQERLEGPAIYQNMGYQDLTADVNFTDLIDWSAPWTSSFRLQTFADFLRPTANPKNPADRTLLDEHGAGSAFLVLEQSPP